MESAECQQIIGSDGKWADCFCFCLLVLGSMCFSFWEHSSKSVHILYLRDSTPFLSLSWCICCVFSRPFQYFIRLAAFVWCYVIRPLNPMIIGLLPQFLHCAVALWVGCCIMWDYISVDLVLCMPFLCGQERQNHTQNKYLLNTCETRINSWTFQDGRTRCGQLATWQPVGQPEALCFG